uniref:Uncharacterized protein n=1 Tax=Arundo donax TaxID=35708 RepID=A0A0A9BSZ5_ARUDO
MLVVNHNNCYLLVPWGFSAQLVYMKIFWGWILVMLLMPLSCCLPPCC